MQSFMALPFQRIFRSSLNQTKYTSQFLHSSIPSLSKFSTLIGTNVQCIIKPGENNLVVQDEHDVLDQLSLLLPIRHKSSININSGEVKCSSDKEGGDINSKVIEDQLLSPEEKLRGIFIQNLRGKNAIKRALSNVRVDELSIDVVAKVVDRGNLGGEDMVMFFNWAIGQPTIAKDVHTYHIILKALGRRKFFPHMMQVLRDMRMIGVDPNSETLFISMDSLIRGHQVTKALHMFGRLEEEFGLKCDKESMNVMLQCLCRRSHVAIASSLVNKMREKVGCDHDTYNIIISGWSRYGRILEMQRVLKEMGEDGFDPDSSTFHHLLEGLGRAGQIDVAVEIFRNLETRNTAVFNGMISNFISVGDLDECLKYYEQMLSNNCDPDIETYVTIISAFLRVRRVADAIEMFDEMLGRGIIPTTGIVTSFLAPLCRYGPPHAALMVYKKAKEVGCKVSLSAYKLLLMRLSRFGKCGMLLNIWNDMQQSGYVSDVEVYEYVINGHCNNGQLENAIVVMEECLHKGFCPSRLICSKLNNKLLTANKVEKAYKLFLKIKDARSDANAQRYWRAKGWHF